MYDPSTTIEDSVTHWLALWGKGDQKALDRVASLVYQDLRRLAAFHLQGEAAPLTFQATELVHEAYLRVCKLDRMDWQGRAHFISVVTTTMRRILVDHARARRAAKRDASLQVMTSSILPEASIDVLAMDEALNRLAQRYPRCGQVVEHRFFGGLEFAEIAEVLQVSLATVERDWRFARAWLQKNLSADRESDS
jgi:RNA polymerase sigma factor (TIGR02999 family)